MERKRINSIITKDYVHLGRGPPFSRQALTVKSLFCESAACCTLKKVIMFPHRGSTSPRSSGIVTGVACTTLEPINVRWHFLNLK